MDDLNGLDWSSSSNTNKAPMTGTGNYYTSMRPSQPPSLSGRSAPLSTPLAVAPKPTAAAISKSSTPDSFSNLVSFGSTKQGNKLTLQEQKERLEAEKAKKTAEHTRQYEAQFGHSQFWDRLSAKPQTLSSTPLTISRSSTPAAGSAPLTSDGFSKTSNNHNTTSNDEDNDLFSAFNAETKVDNSSYYPPPNTSSSNTTVTNNRGETWSKSVEIVTPGGLGDDDDPFGLEQIGARGSAPSPDFARADDDDFLGDLGKPVEEVKRHAKTNPSATGQSIPKESQQELDDPWDKAVNELIDMGFSAEKSRRALTESGAGLDVQAAVGWLLNDAHWEAKQKAQSNRGLAKNLVRENESTLNRDDRDTAVGKQGKETLPAWMRQDSRNQSLPRRDESRSPANSDSDLSKTAAVVGSNLLKTANSLWKTSQKKVQKAVSEFTQDSNPSQPKWMRDASAERQQPREKPNFSQDVQRERNESNTLDVTDEALMLEANARPPPRTKGTNDARFLAPKSDNPLDQPPVRPNQSTRHSTPVLGDQLVTPNPSMGPKSRLMKQATEEQSAQAYVSPARRKKQVPPPRPAETSDLVDDSSTKSHQPPAKAKAAQRRIIEQQEVSRPSNQVKPTYVQPKAPFRNIPTLSPAVLATLTQHRQAGTAYFKQGDYASAHSSYTSSLSSIPKNHPITIVLLSNRSLTALKTGNPKGAVLDADTALNLIGPSRGENESIDLGDGTAEGKKPMKEYWGKALMRKAEALEQMERWKDAVSVWKEAVEAGVGGATATQGRQRCENALAPRPRVSAPQKPLKPSQKAKSTLDDLAPASIESIAAISRLRAANLAAEKADDEKFALSDTVDTRISKWRDGRKENLRALLGGLDQVLWEGSGWKKVGLHELVVISKVKVVYMKAIARVHPDKLPQDSTTEIKMISASVFATLNEAWDKFKTENGI